MTMIVIANSRRLPVSHAFKVPVVRELPPQPRDVTDSAW